MLCRTKESPVPGIDAVDRSPRLLIFNVNGALPTEALTPRDEKFTRKPGKIRTDFLKRKPMVRLANLAS